MDLDDEQQYEVQRPQGLAPDAIRGRVGPDAVGPRQHRVQMHRSEEEQREAGPHLPQPQGRVGVAQRPGVAAKRGILRVARRKLAQCERRMHDDQQDHDRRDTRDQDRVGVAEQEIAFEQPGDRPHRLLAQQDPCDEQHVRPHEERERETAGTLQ
jgi:hypothetical protein